MREPSKAKRAFMLIFGPTEPRPEESERIQGQS